MIEPAQVDRFQRHVCAAADQDIAPDQLLGVAVSGGGDSLALLLLAAAAFPGRVRALSIDHGLREAAGGECRFVGEICHGMDVPHDTVPVAVELRGDGLQAAARRARRIAFGNWCREHRIPWLMTGHHADDQAETVLMRVARGAGVGGLAGIPKIAGLPGDSVRVAEGHLAPLLIRPLLAWRRHELAAIVADAGLPPVNDPSNDDARFDRTRFRRLLATTDLFDVERLSALADHCRDASTAIAAATHALERCALQVADGTATLAVGLLHPRHPEIMHRLLRETLGRLGSYPDGPSIVRLIDALEAGRTATLAGIKCVPKGDVWHFTPAPPHRSADRAS